MGRIDPNFN